MAKFILGNQRLLLLLVIVVSASLHAVPEYAADWVLNQPGNQTTSCNGGGRTDDNQGKHLTGLLLEKGGIPVPLFRQ